MGIEELEELLEPLEEVLLAAVLELALLAVVVEAVPVAGVVEAVVPELLDVVVVPDWEFAAAGAVPQPAATAMAPTSTAPASQRVCRRERAFPALATLSGSCAGMSRNPFHAPGRHRPATSHSSPVSR